MQVERIWRPGHPLDLEASLAPLRRGGGDPTFRIGPDRVLWRAVSTPAGPGTLCVRWYPATGEVCGSAWGCGAQWLIEGMPDLLGAADSPAGFRPLHSAVAAGWRGHAAWRAPRARAVFDVLVPTVLEQKVTGLEARRSWRELVRRFGAPAPGPAPAGLMTPPSAADWKSIPSWQWHLAGVDDKRASTIVTAAWAAGRLEETLGFERAAAGARLRALPGVGEWTVAEVRQRAYGDVDAVSVGDFHLSSLVGWALAGRPVDDAEMLELLEPYAGQRYRAIRMIELSGVALPRFGPRASVRDYRTL